MSMCAPHPPVGQKKGGGVAMDGKGVQHDQKSG